MPSGSETVTVAEAAQRTGLPIRVIANWHDDGHLKLHAMIRNRAGQAGYDGRPLKGKLVRSFLWRDVEALFKQYRPGPVDHGSIELLIPPGHITVYHASRLLRIDANTVRKAVQTKAIAGTIVPMNGVSKRVHTFVLKEAVDAILEEKKLNQGDCPGHGAMLPNTAPPSSPLITANHVACLAARTEAWERNGRIMLRKYRISVASRRKAG